MIHIVSRFIFPLNFSSTHVLCECVRALYYTNLIVLEIIHSDHTDFRPCWMQWTLLPPIKQSSVRNTTYRVRPKGKKNARGIMRAVGDGANPRPPLPHRATHSMPHHAAPRRHRCDSTSGVATIFKFLFLQESTYVLIPHL